MAKITAHGGPSDKTLPDAVVQTDAVLTEQQAEELREAVDSDAEPLPFEASVEPTAPEEDEGEEPQIGNDFSASPEESEPEPGYEEWTVEQLKEELAVRDLPKSGKRDDLVQRLRDADAAAQDSE